MSPPDPFTKMMLDKYLPMSSFPRQLTEVDDEEDADGVDVDDGCGGL